jgi:hypothetical protein
MAKILDTVAANDAISQHALGKSITKDQIAELLQTTRGTTFAALCSVTPVKTASAFKEVDIKKVSISNVQLFNNLKEYTDVYVNAVERSSGSSDFVKSETWFHHTDCFPVVEHNTNFKQYLWAIFNHADTMYVRDGVEMTRAQVSEYLTPSEAKKMLEPSKTVYNVTNDIAHNITVRTIALENVVWIRANHLMIQK